MMVEQEREGELSERWSAKGKAEVVLRLLRGEAVEAVSREIRRPAHELESWKLRQMRRATQLVSDSAEIANLRAILSRHWLC